MRSALFFPSSVANQSKREGRWWWPSLVCRLWGWRETRKEEGRHTQKKTTFDGWTGGRSRHTGKEKEGEPQQQRRLTFVFVFLLSPSPRCLVCVSLLPTHRAGVLCLFSSLCSCVGVSCVCMRAFVCMYVQNPLFVSPLLPFFSQSQATKAKNARPPPPGLKTVNALPHPHCRVV